MTAPAPYFAILGSMRTGSNLLERTLAGLGDVVCYGEAYNPSFVGGPRQTQIGGWGIAARNADPGGFLAMLRREAGAKITGFRVFDGHATAFTRQILADPDCRRIVLRRDPLESYLSLKAARDTGQWILRRAARRIQVRVTFDGEEYSAYRSKLGRHYAWIEEEMRRAGTEAFFLSYPDLLDRDVLQAVASHIGSAGAIPAEQPILKQNPTSLADRVINYAEMCDWLGIPAEHRSAPRLPGGGAIEICRTAPLALAPIPGPGAEAGLSLIYRLAYRSFGGEALSYAQLLDPVEREKVFISGLPASELAVALETRRLLAVICHPLRRLHALFQTELFGPGWHGSVIRRHLVSKHGGIPSPREINEGSKTLDADRHRALFAEFVGVLETAVGGEGAVPDRVEWRAQADLIASYRRAAHIDDLVRLEELRLFAARLASDVGAAPLKDAHIDTVLERAFGPYVDFGDVASEEIAFRVRQLHAADYACFGYDLLPDGAS